MISRGEPNEAGVFCDIDEAAMNRRACRVLALTGDELRPPDLVIPLRIATLVNLEELRLEEFGEITFPDVVRQLTTLKRVTIECANAVFPAPLLSLVGLEALRLALPRFTLPTAIRSLKKLEFLELEGVEDLGRGLGGLARLRELRVSGRRLRSLPDETAALASLRRLDLSYGAFPVFPKVITHLTALEELDIGHTCIDELPLEIGRLEKLRVLRFAKPFEHHDPAAYRTRVKQIRQAWCGLTALRVLDLSGQNIIDCSASVSKFVHLEELDLSYNEMPEVPEELFAVPNVRRVNLDFNALREIPPSIAAWRSLEHLSLIDNPLGSHVPLTKLGTLRTLDLRRVDFTAAQFDEIERALPACRVTKTSP